MVAKPGRDWSLPKKFLARSHAGLHDWFCMSSLFHSPVGVSVPQGLAGPWGRPVWYLTPGLSNREASGPES